ncbi:MAG: DUF5686 family protein [Chitinophagia bacterium]|jgi:hypothetical protein
MKIAYLFLLGILLKATTLEAQSPTVVVGKVRDAFTKEPIPFSTIQWALSKAGTIADSLGHFKIPRSSFVKDSLLVSYVGYDQSSYSASLLKKDSVIITLNYSTSKQEATVKSKFNKGLRWWKLVVDHKKENNPYQYPEYSCELYNKLELDLNNINKNSFSNINFLKPFAFVLDNIDSISESKPFLPVLMTETLSDFYYTSLPKNSREVIKATQSHGIQSEVIIQLISGVNQKVNIYENYMKFFGKEFISPISEFADKFYKFKGADTQYVKGAKIFHLLFSPLREGENTFNGDAWIDAETWGIYKVNLNISKTADINFVNRLNVNLEFAKLENRKMIFSKDKITADMSPFPNDKLTFIVRKSISYKNFKTDKALINENIQRNSKQDQVVSLANAAQLNTTDWVNLRHDELNKNEQSIRKSIDTLKSIPLFKAYTRNIEFLVDGYRKFGKVEIGPWYKWISGNQLESTRLRFDLATTPLFNKDWKFSGYLAYGFKDQKFKEKLAIQYKPAKYKGLLFQLSYLNDLDNGRVRFNEEDVSIDNIFSQILRRPTIPQKFLGEEEYKASITKEWESGVSNSLTLERTNYNPYTPLPTNTISQNGKQEAIVNSDLMYRIRYAPGERKFTTNRRVIRFKGSKPIFELRVSEGFKGLFGSAYQYTKIHAGMEQKVRIPNFGVLTYNAYAGKIYGDSLPFMLLELHPGNEVYMYNKNGFNLMNRFEYYSDLYAGFQIEHNFEKKLINLIPFLRTTKMRQFWTFKGVWGEMNSANRTFNRTELGPYQLRSLKSNFYLEYGTGFDNILKFFRIDFVWRQAPPYPPNYSPSRMQPIQNFGVFGSVRFQF